MTKQPQSWSTQVYKTQKERQGEISSTHDQERCYGRKHIGFQIKIWETGKREAALMTSSETLDPVGPEDPSFLKKILFIFA